MEEQCKIHSPTQEKRLWMSPDVSSHHINRQVGELASTPDLSVWPSLARHLEDSEGSSKQDSGYSSFTPRSSNSLRSIFNKKCQFCSKVINQSYVESTPESECIMCTCKKDIFENHSPNEYLQPISETKASPSKLILPKINYSRTFNFYDEAMDTSLYPDEMEVEETGETHQCSLSLSGIADEKSIDFVDSGVCLPSDTIKDNEIIKEKFNLQVGERANKIEGSFSPKTGVFSNNTDSHKELTLANVRRSSNFQNVATKVATLNRVVRSFSLHNIDRVDFLYHLGVRINVPHVIGKILSFLSERDLDSVRVVSKTWNEIMYKDFPSYNRWKLFRSAMIMRKENATSPTKAGGSGLRQRPVPFSSLHIISNQFSPSRTDTPHQLSPPVSPKSARWHSFHKAGKSLKKGERILQCPKCYFPSYDRGSPTVQCSRSGCRHRFCVWCRNEASSGVSHNCPPLYTPRTRRDTHKLPSIGSKVCRRNLRRL